MGPIFFDGTVCTEVNHGISKQLSAQFTDHERENFLFIWDGATCHNESD